MDLRDLVKALLAFDALRARQWVSDAIERRLRWADFERPERLSAVELALAAGVVEMLARRAGEEPPGWAREVRRSPGKVFLVRAADSMPRLRRLCEEEGPPELRRKGFFAPPEFLTVA
jgi:hypothetical protein